MKQIPLDSLSDERVANAVALLRHVRRFTGPHWFTTYSTGGQCVFDLYRAGYGEMQHRQVMPGVRALRLLPRGCRA